MAVNQQRSSQARLSRVLDHLAIERQGALDRLFQFLAIPSASTDPAYHAACVTAAEWCANGLREIGFQARVENTPGKPMVVGHLARLRFAVARAVLRTLRRAAARSLGGVDRPALRAAPRARSSSGRGHRCPRRSDDKGQVMTFLEACRSWLAVHGRLPIDMTVL